MHIYLSIIKISLFFYVQNFDFYRARIFNVQIFHGSYFSMYYFSKLVLVLWVLIQMCLCPNVCCMECNRELEVMSRSQVTRSLPRRNVTRCVRWRKMHSTPLTRYCQIAPTTHSILRWVAALCRSESCQLFCRKGGIIMCSKISSMAVNHAQFHIIVKFLITSLHFISTRYDSIEKYISHEQLLWQSNKSNQQYILCYQNYNFYINNFVNSV